MSSESPTGSDLEAIQEMGWESYPYGCLGLLRRNEVSGKVLWSWLILIPWAKAGGKPWIDGTELMDPPLATEKAEAEKVKLKIRKILDDRYGDSIGESAVDAFLEQLRDGG